MRRPPCCRAPHPAPLRVHVPTCYLPQWPDRYVPLFGAAPYDAANERESVPFEEQLAALDRVVREGKVRHVGVSNETSWGVMRFTQAAREGFGPKIVSIENSYSLLVRGPFETGGQGNSRQGWGVRCGLATLAAVGMTERWAWAPPGCSKGALQPGRASMRQGHKWAKQACGGASWGRGMVVAPFLGAASWVPTEGRGNSGCRGAASCSQPAAMPPAAALALLPADLAEVCAPKQCNVGLLAYSPLSGGSLSGKYMTGDQKLLARSRFSLFKVVGWPC